MRFDNVDGHKAQPAERVTVVLVDRERSDLLSRRQGLSQIGKRYFTLISVTPLGYRSYTRREYPQFTSDLALCKETAAAGKDVADEGIMPT